METAMSPETRVDSLSADQIRDALVRVVEVVECYGASPQILKALNGWSLLSDRVADVPDNIAPSLVLAMDHFLKTPTAKPAKPIVTPAPEVSDLARILATPLPPFRANIRRRTRKERSAEIRKLLKDLKIKGVSVTTPDYSMAQSTEIVMPRAAEHDYPHDHDRINCLHCTERREAETRLEAIILAAFPDLDNRSDSMSDHFDYCLSIQ